MSLHSCCHSEWELVRSALIMSLLSPLSSRQASSSPVRSRSLSPSHSPQVDKASPIGGRDQRAEEVVGKGLIFQSRGGDSQQNALLKVTEAHLAILPDEDGDT